MTTTSQIDSALLGYGSAEPDPIVDVSPSVTSTCDDDGSSDSSTDDSSRTSSTHNGAQQEDTKVSLRKLMVSCIDSALEELGPLGDIAQDLKLNKSSEKSVLPSLTATKFSSPSPMPTAEQLYGYGPSSPKVCPELKEQIRGRMRRGQRYQRRGSVTKFSLSAAFKQVQKEDLQGKLQPATTSPLWQHLYSKNVKTSSSSSTPHLPATTALKRTALNFHHPNSTSLHHALRAVDGPVAKRRRACL